MLVDITFSGGKSVTVEHTPGASDLVKTLADRSDSRFLGDYFYIANAAGGHIWVNPNVIAYVHEHSNN